MPEVQEWGVSVKPLLIRRAIDGEREYTAELWDDGKISVRVLASSDYHMIDEGEANGVRGTLFLDVINCHPAQWLEALMEASVPTEEGT